MDRTERALLVGSLRFVTGLVEGKAPVVAGLEALLHAFGAPQRTLPPRPAIDFQAWAAAQRAKQAATPAQTATPPVDAQVQKRIEDLEARAVHENTPVEEARTAALKALRLRHGKAGMPDPVPVPEARSSASQPQPTRPASAAPRPRPSPAPAPAPIRGLPLLAPANAVSAAPRTRICAKCSQKIHRGGIDVAGPIVRLSYHKKCQPKGGR